MQTHQHRLNGMKTIRKLEFILLVLATSLKSLVRKCHLFGIVCVECAIGRCACMRIRCGRNFAQKCSFATWLETVITALVGTVNAASIITENGEEMLVNWHNSVYFSSFFIPNVATYWQLIPLGLLVDVAPCTFFGKFFLFSINIFWLYWRRDCEIAGFRLKRVCTFFTYTQWLMFLLLKCV